MSKKITHEEKIQWMAVWAAKNRFQLVLEGECGFGRECVGISAENLYPDYEWYDNNFNRIDNNGEVWTPPNAYHKHPCVAVLGLGEESESQLYDWLKWFDEHHFKLEIGDIDPKEREHLGVLSVMLGENRFVRMVKGE